jgi:agmatinase
MNAPPPTLVPTRPFLNWPIETNPARMSADIALLGIPYSEPYVGDSWPNDQTRAPDAVRQAFDQYCGGTELWDFDLGADLGSLLPAQCLDCGNAPWVEGNYDTYAAQVTEYLSRLWRNRTQVLVIGGDHGVTIPALDALEVLGESIYIVHVDAHLDWREEVGGVRRGYSSPLRWASTKSYVLGMTQIGLRGTGSARRGEFEAARDYGSRIFTAEEFHAVGYQPVLATVPAGCPVYLTIDADGLDPTEAPGVLWPVPGGVRFHQIVPLVRAIARRNRIVGMDIVEVAPNFDAANHLTCIVAGRLFLNAIGASWGPDGAYRRNQSRSA